MSESTERTERLVAVCKGWSFVARLVPVGQLEATMAALRLQHGELDFYADEGIADSALAWHRWRSIVNWLHNTRIDVHIARTSRACTAAERLRLKHLYRRLQRAAEEVALTTEGDWRDALALLQLHAL